MELAHIKEVITEEKVLAGEITAGKERKKSNIYQNLTSFCSPAQKGLFLDKGG